MVPKGWPTFYQAMTFSSPYPHKRDLSREKKTKVLATVALLSPASTCCLQRSITPTRHWQHATNIAWTKRSGQQNNLRCLQLSEMGNCGDCLKFKNPNYISKRVNPLEGSHFRTCQCELYHDQTWFNFHLSKLCFVTFRSTLSLMLT